MLACHLFYRMERLVVVVFLLISLERCVSYENLLADKLRSKYKEGESKTQCKVVEFYLNIREERLPFQQVKVNFCEGGCKSSYIPKPSSSSLMCFSKCVPSKTVMHTITLNANSNYTYTEIKACSCSKEKCKEALPENP